VALLDRAAILLPSITMVVFDLGRSPVPSITVAPFKIIIPVLLGVDSILILDSDTPAAVTVTPTPRLNPATARATAKTKTTGSYSKGFSITR
jgi:hypothetical protein